MKPFRFLGTAALLLSTLAGTAALADNTVRWGVTNDALSMDPQGQLSSSSFPYLRMVYEGLTVLTPELKPAPGLAESWERLEPNVWRFKLREGVTFHEGQDLTAEDVVFSLKRASEQESAFRLFTRTIKDVAAIDNRTVEITTIKPDPLLLRNLASLFIMDSGWARENGVVAAKSYKNPQKYYSDQNTNGTGPFKLVDRKVDVSSKFVRNTNWWGNGQFPGNLDEVTIVPISNAATRVAAMLSGELDLLTGVPIADAGRLEADERFKLETTPQLRTILFSFNQEVDKLMSGSIDTNPFKDVRVREAVGLAINSELIKDRIMRGYSMPTSILVPPGLAGYNEQLATPKPADPERAKALLTEAGYPDGFDVRLDCPNNRYVNDEPICQAAVSMLAKVGIRVTLNALPGDQWAPLVNGHKSDFYLLGYGTPTTDSLFMAQSVLQPGPFDAGYDNAEINALVEKAQYETDDTLREQIMTEIFATAKKDSAIVPLHYQTAIWSLVQGLQMPIDPDNIADFRYAVKN